MDEMTGCMNTGTSDHDRSTLTLVDDCSLPIYEQIAGWLRNWIISGAIAPGTRLPSVRQLSRYTKVAIATIRHSIELLEAEGWLVAKRGSGTYVSESISERVRWINEQQTGAPKSTLNELSTDDVAEVKPDNCTSAWGRRVNSTFDQNLLSEQSQSSVEIDFRVGAAVTEMFADASWTDIMQRASRDAVLMSGGNHDPQGMLELRERIAKWLNTHRGMNTTADNVVIVNGAQQARNIVARLFVNRGTRLVLEEPGSVFARNTFKSSGAEIVPVAVDDSGLIIEELERTSNVQLLYTTPSAQFPTGAVLAHSRRKRIADWADHNNAIIVEDDNHSELIYESRPAPAIASLNQERTIYFGSFAQLLLPTWRLGYMVVPSRFVQAVVRLKYVIDCGTSPVIQHIALELFKTGQLRRHLAKVQRMCSTKRDVLLLQLESLTGSGCRYTPVKGGLHQTIWLPPATDDVEIFTSCYTAGVGLLPVSPHFVSPPRSPGLLLNFSAVTAQQIEQGIWRIRKVLGGQHGS